MVTCNTAYLGFEVGGGADLIMHEVHARNLPFMCMHELHVNWSIATIICDDCVLLC